MNLDQKTQIGKAKKNKRAISSEPVSKLSDSLYARRTSSSQLMTPGKKPILLHFITSTAQLKNF